MACTRDKANIQRTVKVEATTFEPWALAALFMAIKDHAEVSGFRDVQPQPRCQITVEFSDWFESLADFEVAKTELRQRLIDMNVLDNLS